MTLTAPALSSTVTVPGVPWKTAKPGCGDIAARASPLASVQVAEVSVQVPLPPGALAETGAQMFRTGGGTGGWSGRRSGLAGDGAPAEAAGANNATAAAVETGEMTSHVLSLAGALADTSGEPFDESRGGTDSLSKQKSVVVNDGAAASNVRVHSVTVSAQAREMAIRVPSPRAAAATGARKFVRAGGGTDALLGRESGIPCDGTAARVWDAHNARATAIADASERLRL